MKIVALEEHFILPKEEHNLPPGAQRGNDREKLLGFDVVAGLLDLGGRRLAAMNAAGIAVQVLSHNQPGCQALDGAEAIAVAREVNDMMFEATSAHPGRFAALASLPTADPAADFASFLHRTISACADAPYSAQAWPAAGYRSAAWRACHFF
jgi:predicted TIM-barrel fold metal-dependent hydrolase